MFFLFFFFFLIFFFFDCVSGKAQGKRTKAKRSGGAAVTGLTRVLLARVRDPRALRRATDPGSDGEEDDDGSAPLANSSSEEEEEEGGAGAAEDVLANGVVDDTALDPEYVSGDEAIELISVRAPQHLSDAATTDPVLASAGSSASSSSSSSSSSSARVVRVRRRRRSDPLLRAAYSAALARAASEHEPPPPRLTILLMCVFWTLHAAAVAGFSGHVISQYLLLDADCRSAMVEGGGASSAGAEQNCDALARCAWRPAPLNPGSSRSTRYICSAGSGAVAVLSVTATALFLFALAQGVKLAVICCRVCDEGEPDVRRHWNMGGNIISSSPFVVCLPASALQRRTFNWNAPILAWIDLVTTTIPFLLAGVWALVINYGSATYGWLVVIFSWAHTTISFCRRRGMPLHPFLSKSPKAKSSATPRPNHLPSKPHDCFHVHPLTCAIQRCVAAGMEEAKSSQVSSGSAGPSDNMDAKHGTEP
jgi:hypothetical protein